MTAESIAAVLGGRKALRRNIETSADLVALTREGLPSGTLWELSLALETDKSIVARSVGISTRTLSRRLSSRARLSPAESDRTVRLARILALATETLGDRANASRWLQTANRALDGRVPFELLDTDAGVQSVETILGRIAYGVYS